MQMRTREMRAALQHFLCGVAALRGALVAAERWSYLGVLVTLIAWSCYPASMSLGGDPNRDDELLESLVRAYTDDALGRTMQSQLALFGNASDRQIGELKTHRNDGVAVRAAWEVVRRAVAGDPDARPPRAALDRFIGFVEGRIQCAVPAWWESAVHSTEYGHPCTAPFERESGSPYHSAKPNVLAPLGTTVDMATQDVVVTVGRDSFRFPLSITNGKLPERLSALVEGERCYVGLHSDVAIGYRLICTPRRSGEVVWVGRVWGSGLGSYSGLSGCGHHWVAVVPRGDSVVVFGADDFAAYLEGFDAKSGVPLFRFSTFY